MHTFQIYITLPEYYTKVGYTFLSIAARTVLNNKNVDQLLHEIPACSLFVDCKESTLKRALSELEQYTNLADTLDVIHSIASEAPITGLTLHSGLRYNIDECGFLSLAMEIVERYQFK